MISLAQSLNLQFMTVSSICGSLVVGHLSIVLDPKVLQLLTLNQDSHLEIARLVEQVLDIKPLALPFRLPQVLDCRGSWIHSTLLPCNYHAIHGCSSILFLEPSLFACSGVV